MADARLRVPAPPRPRLLYILSPSYSGSTLLTYLLSQHPRIATVGELKATQMGDVAQYHCSCGELITVCAFWRAVTDICQQRGVPFSVAAFGTSLTSPNWLTDRLLRTRVRGRLFELTRHALLKALPNVRRETTVLVKRNVDISQAVCAVQGGDLFLDGSKDATRFVVFHESGMWDAQAIFLTRDGRGVVNSFMTRRGFTIDMAVERWRRTISEHRNVVAGLKRAAVFQLKYERLCESPDTVLGELWRWLKVPESSFSTNFRVGEHHILGNDMRLGQLSEIRLDERWRTKLGPGDLEYFDQRAGAINRALGYQ